MFYLLIYSLFLLWSPAFSHESDDVKFFRPYDVVQINDPSIHSAGIYFRISQRGVDYLANLTTEGLPLIFHRMVLPTISEKGFTIKDAVITRITRPEISIKFVEGHGIDISIRLPELEIRGEAGLDVLFITYQSQVIALSNDMHVNMRVAIHRHLNESSTNVTVSQCSVDPGSLKMNYYGADAGEFYTIGNMIKDGIEHAIRDKICMLPLLLREFIHEKIDLLMQPPKANEHFNSTPSDDDTVLDHLCGKVDEDKPSGLWDSPYEEDKSEPDVGVNEVGGAWLPDLTMRYPPTFSEKDFIFGVDGGILVNGASTSNSLIERPRLENLSVLRDQMLGLIVSEYVPNTLFQQVFDHGIGTIYVSYNINHLPRLFKPLARLFCAECKLMITANLTKAPVASVNKNGVQLKLEGDVSALFFRKNGTRNILTASGLILANIKPHFRQSRLFGDVMLGGIDFKVQRGGISGLVAGMVRKIVGFMVPKVIWPRIQQRLRMVISHKGIRIPRFCTLELRNLHLDYVDHAGVMSSDFDVDLPLLVRSFKQFMDSKLKSTQTLKEYQELFRYLK